MCRKPLCFLINKVNVENIILRANVAPGALLNPNLNKQLETHLNKQLETHSNKQLETPGA